MCKLFFGLTRYKKTILTIGEEPPKIPYPVGEQNGVAVGRPRCGAAIGCALVGMLDESLILSIDSSSSLPNDDICCVKFNTPSFSTLIATYNGSGVEEEDII